MHIAGRGARSHRISRIAYKLDVATRKLTTLNGSARSAIPAWSADSEVRFSERRSWISFSRRFTWEFWSTTSSTAALIPSRAPDARGFLKRDGGTEVVWTNRVSPRAHLASALSTTPPAGPYPARGRLFSDDRRDGLPHPRTLGCLGSDPAPEPLPGLRGRARPPGRVSRVRRVRLLEVRVTSEGFQWKPVPPH